LVSDPKYRKCKKSDNLHRSGSTTALGAYSPRPYRYDAARVLCSDAHRAPHPVCRKDPGAWRAPAGPGCIPYSTAASASDQTHPGTPSRACVCNAALWLGFKCRKWHGRQQLVISNCIDPEYFARLCRLSPRLRRWRHCWRCGPEGWHWRRFNHARVKSWAQSGQKSTNAWIATAHVYFLGTLRTNVFLGLDD
jgi:hypothetical protein